LLVGALLLEVQAALAATSIKTVSLEAPEADAARVQLQLSAPPRQNVFTLDKTLDKPHRVVIDLQGTHLAPGLRLPAAAGPVRLLRAGMQEDGTLRLVLELNRALDPKVTTNGTQLTIELGQMPAINAPPKPVRAAHAPEDAGRDIIVAVDAGHGGKDSGAIGAAGTREKDVVLAIARALEKRINDEPGMRAYLTRDTDRFIVLRDRIDLARRAHADIFVSVHADSIKDRSVTGSSVYVLSEKGASSEAARWLAEQENAADLKGGIPVAEQQGAMPWLLMDLSQSASITASMDAAVSVLARLDKVGTVRKSAVQQAGFLVLKSPDIPSMLVETAYISNPGEEKNLRSAAHQARIAEAIFTGVRDYFRASPPDGTLFARQKAAARGAPTIVADSTGP
jgi:N-acetylmuramoyl-L-alanine amidase